MFTVWRAENYNVIKINIECNVDMQIITKLADGENLPLNDIIIAPFYNYIIITIITLLITYTLALQ